jgi:hypothetical protein
VGDETCHSAYLALYTNHSFCQIPLICRRKFQNTKITKYQIPSDGKFQIQNPKFKIQNKFQYLNSNDQNKVFVLNFEN